jgi:trimeric autotransporter adhesin
LLRPTTRFFLASVLLLGTSANALAQQFTGGIRGAVRDANGVIPGVAVKAINEDTAVSRETVTNGVGEYNFPALAPANYTIRTSLAGYKTFERRGIRITTQTFITLDLILEVGAIEESVTVTGASPLVETSNASVGGVLDRDALESLPSPGRNAYMMGVEVPTVLAVGEPRFNRQQDQMVSSQISLGGGGVQANNYTLDGVAITDIRGFPALNATIEAISDVKVQVHTYDAEMARTGGGVFNVTARSGGNNFHGSAFYQNRPLWGQSVEYFAAQRGQNKTQSGLDATYYNLYGSGVGGPIVKNRTFFWFANEGYRDSVPQGLSLTWPSRQQDAGDFSTTTVGGRPVQIFNPYCRGGVVTAQCPATGTGSLATGGLFTGAIIPANHPAANPVAFKMASYFPAPLQSNTNSLPNEATTVNLPDIADMFTIKVEHKFTAKSSLSGLFIYNHTQEPAASPQPDSLSFLDNNANWLIRHPKVFVLNNTNVLSDTAVLSVRYGFTTFPDGRNCRGGSPGTGCFSDGLASLGFSQTLVGAVDSSAKNLFPISTFQNFSSFGANLNTAPIVWRNPIALNAAYSKLLGPHSVKIGGDFRKMQVETTLLNNTGGNYAYQSAFTQGPGAVGGYDFASFLLGVPTSGTIDTARGGGVFYLYYGGGYIQDDWRVNSRFTFNYGVRLEHESGMREQNNQITVGFDPNATSPALQALDAAARLKGYTGPALKGGLIFAGVNGAPTYQGDPPAIKPAPRAGFTWSLDNGGITVLRGGAGLFWAPWQYTQQNQGTIGFTASTAMNQSAPESAVPITSLTNPFPTGLQPPTQSSLGIMTGVGNNISYVDPNKKAPKVYQYSVDLQRELPGQMALSLGYVGARGVDIGFGGFTDSPLEMNQINPAALALNANGQWDAAALRRSVPNPFFGLPGAGSLGAASTILAGQLLRPYPQFQNISQLQTTEGGKRNYNAIVVKLDKRPTSHHWGGSFNYTWSRMKDNQWGQTSTYGASSGTPQNNYNLDAEYSLSNIDTPHRLVLSPIVRFPEPTKGTAMHWLLGGWNAAASIEFKSGPPVSAYMTTLSPANLGLFGGLQRPNFAGADVCTFGIATASTPTATYLNPAGYANPGVGSFGNATRNSDSCRYAFYKNTDAVFTKDTAFGNGMSAQVRFEILNLFNTPHFAGASSTDLSAAAFGTITTSRGFSRIWQMSYRFKF